MNQTEKQSKKIPRKKHIHISPLHKQFTHTFIALSLIMIVIIGLVSAFFYQSNVRNNTLVATQLTPLEQELKEIKTLQKAEKLVTDLLLEGNAEHFIQIHNDLISTNRLLLQENSSNVQVFQQWLNQSILAEDIISRIQSSHTRNQQLKQSSIIQLQLMIVSITPIIDSELSSHKELRDKQFIGSSTFDKANAYIISAQQISDLEQLKSLLVEVLLGFEQLNMHTSSASFEQLRLKVEQVFVQHKKVQSNNPLNESNDFDRLSDAFKKIVLTEQRALAKWQGYLRLSQDYQLELKSQQQNIRQLILAPYTHPQVFEQGIINNLLNKLEINLSNKNILIILVTAICFLLLLFFYLLWGLRNRIKKSAQKGVEIIERSVQKKDENIDANCLEIQEIMNQVLSISKPQHNECEFQQLSGKYEECQLLLTQQEATVSQLTQCNEQLHVDSKEAHFEQLRDELNRYQLLETSLLSMQQQFQLNIFHQNALTERDSPNLLSQLTLLRERCSLFNLSLEMKLEQSVLQLTDINLINEVHAILFNKQQEHGIQLFICCDEHLLSKVKIDERLFQQLISLFIDISLSDSKATQVYFHLQLQDRNIGQQLVHITAKVSAKSVETLPEAIIQLVDSQSGLSALSPLINVFNVLFTKQHGENIVAQLVDDGYQLSFEIPFAIANSDYITDKVTIDNIKILLLSSHVVLGDFIEKAILSALGQFERYTRLESFQSNFCEKQLHLHKVDVLVITSDIAVNHFNLINQQINSLPISLRPKLMLLQSEELPYERFGFYSQSENILCKNSFLQSIVNLLESKDLNNQLTPKEEFLAHQFIVTELPLLLAVQSPLKYQNLQRLLHWLGLKVKVVSHDTAQKALWKTGEYSLLVTEFIDSSLIEMEIKPVAKVGVFSLKGVSPILENSADFGNWHIDTLSVSSTLTELIAVLNPWLKQKGIADEISEIQGVHEVLNCSNEYLEELVITEALEELPENSSQAAFDFSQYLQNQGSVDLALFMMDEYSQDNHQQLNILIKAIKTKDTVKAKQSISVLSLNAQILSAKQLKALCIQWEKIFSDTGTSCSLEEVSTLIKETTKVLNEIDDYAESI
jgi:hypothetical protein